VTITEGTAVDGRNARRDRNRNAVLDAALELFGEDNLEPSPEQVAERSGVSLRSVYRYFEDRDELLRSAIDRRLEVVVPLLHLPSVGEGRRAERIDRLVTSRLRLYAEVGPTARASRRKALTNDVLRKSVERTHRTLREQVELHFAPELDALEPERDGIAAAIDVLFQLEAIDHLTLVRGFTPDEVGRHLRVALAALLATADQAGEGPR